MLNLKRWLCLALTGLMVTITPLTVSAKEANQPANYNFLTTENQGPFQTLDIPEVTKEQLADFEKTYASSNAKLFAPIDTSQTAEMAKKRAAIFTSLYQTTSLQYALMQDGEIILSGQSGYQDKDLQNAPDANTMYGIASISKVFVTIAIMQLVEDGLVDLDAPVVTYLPEFKMADSRYKDITVRMLLNHSSGLMGSTLTSCVLLGDNSTYYHDNLLRQLKSQKLKADPGAFSVYCNDGFTLAEMVVEKVSGQTYTAYMAENITGPLGMTNTKTPMDSFKTSQLAKVYQDVSSKKALPYETFNALGAGGLYSTAEDLCRMSTLFMAGTNKGDVLSNASAQITAAEEYKRGLWTETTSGVLDYGLGWDSVNTYPFPEYGIKALSKGGDSIYYHSQVMVLPEKNLSVAVTSVGSSSSMNQVLGQSILLDYMKEQGMISEIIEAPKNTAPVKSEVPEDLKQYKGYYGNMSGVYQIQVKDDSLILSNAYAPDSKFTYIYNGDGTFKDAAGSETLSFTTEANGNKYLAGTSYVPVPGIGNLYLNQFQAQKLESNSLSTKVKKAWEARNGKLYFIVNERYTSTVYLSGPLASIALPAKLEGYMGNAKIVDANNAVACLQIPVQAGRDLANYQFVQKNNGEYLKMRGMIGVEEKAVKNLSSKAKFNVTISNTTGWAKWYKVSKANANKKVTVTCPKAGMFAIYDKDGICLNNSYVTGKKTVKLPKDGYVVFAGDKGKTFTVKYTK